MIFKIYKIVTIANLMVVLAYVLKDFTTNKLTKEEKQEQYKEKRKDLEKNLSILPINLYPVLDIMDKCNNSKLISLLTNLVLCCCPLLHILFLYSNMCLLIENK